VSIFKACDIRGVYPEELGVVEAEGIGRALGAELDGAECVLAGDVRLSTPPLKQALQEGLVSAGAKVLDLGIVPTPVAYWAKRRLRVRGAVIVTASHNPPRYNGVKFMIGDLPVTPDDVRRVQRRVESGCPAPGGGSVAPVEVRSDYLAWLGTRFGQSERPLTVLVDAGNGTVSDWAPEAFHSAGYRVEALFCDPDGRFPNRSPNPSHPDALEAAQEEVRRRGVDFAACFDGDGDRVVFLDETGRFVPPEESLILLLRDELQRRPGAVVYDLKCTRTVPGEIERAGGRPVMERSGHAFIKRRMLKEDAVLAGEASGHFFFEELGGDDGLYAALRMGELIASSGRPLAELTDTIPPYFISEDIRIRRPRGDAAEVIETLRERFAHRPQDHTDGVRIEFDGGWALCRPSVTEPAITIRVEGETPRRMEEIRREILEAVRGEHM
jgi:phosphomannomutase/phosphoglucomutase